MLGQAEHRRHGLHLRERHDARGVAGADDIAHIHRPQAGAAIDGRPDDRVIENGPGVVDGGLIDPHLRFELGHRGLLRVRLLARAEIAGGEARVAVEIDAGVLQLRLVLRLLGDHLIIERLIGARIDAGEHVALLHILPVAEAKLHEPALHLRPHHHRIERLHGADRIDGDGHILPHQRGGEHGHDLRPSLGATSAKDARTLLRGLGGVAAEEGNGDEPEAISAPGAERGDDEQGEELLHSVTASTPVTGPAKTITARSFVQPPPKA